MKTGRLSICVGLAGLLILDSSTAWSAPSENSGARQLIARVLEASRTSGVRIRSKLSVIGPDRRDVKQLLIKGRNDGRTHTTLYQVLWPAELKGQSLVVEKSGHSVSGFLFEPPATIKKLSAGTMAQPFFGSDLSIEDLAEDFWDWPSQKIVGEETIKDRVCQIVESRPPGDASTSYSLIKTWIAPDILLPLRVEKYGKNKRLVRRITADRIMKVGERWTAANIAVDLEGSSTRTLLEGSKSDRDLDLPVADFTVEAIKRDAAARDGVPH